VKFETAMRDMVLETAMGDLVLETAMGDLWYLKQQWENYDVCNSHGRFGVIFRILIIKTKLRA